MKSLVALTLFATGMLLGGCAAQRQLPVPLGQETVNPKSGPVGVAMTALPKIDTALPGASCLLCLAFASAANSALTDHARTLSYEDLPKLKNEVAELLRRKGMDVRVIEDAIDIAALPRYGTEGTNVAKKDFSSLRQKYGVEKLLVINVTELGFRRTYSAYIATSDPKGSFQGLGYIVNLKNNTYEWYMAVNLLKSAGNDWDEPPKYPALTNAYFQALELGKDSFLKTFGN